MNAIHLSISIVGNFDTLKEIPFLHSIICVMMMADVLCYCLIFCGARWCLIVECRTFVGWQFGNGYIYVIVHEHRRYCIPYLHVYNGCAMSIDDQTSQYSTPFRFVCLAIWTISNAALRPFVLPRNVQQALACRQGMHVTKVMKLMVLIATHDNILINAYKNWLHILFYCCFFRVLFIGKIGKCRFLPIRIVLGTP